VVCHITDRRVPAGVTGTRKEHPIPYEIRPIGHVESPLVDREAAPEQGFEGAPDAWLVFDAEVAGVFSTRSQDRPNPIGLHRIRIAAIDGLRVLVRDLEAFDGTPIVDVKPVLRGEEAGWR
jgi:tRNA (Thr-GGU) A37 N-methylase